MNLTDQEVTAGQVVVSHLTAGGVEGPGSLIGVLSSKPLTSLNTALRRLPVPADVSMVLKTVNEPAARLGATAATAVAPASIRKPGPR